MTRAILADIEGTTSSIAFVKETLFPYAREHMAAWVHAHRNEERVTRQLAEVSRQGNLQEDDITGAIALLHHWIDTDQKITPLKTLQGWLWEDGYRQNHYRAHVYPDVVPRLEQWKELGKRISIYSSGSVNAQKWFFRHTENGDLSGFFDGHFDTSSGHKKEAESYTRIAAAMGFDPSEILFLSDVVGELDAAREAGMNTWWLVRDGQDVSAATHRWSTTFEDIVV